MTSKKRKPVKRKRPRAKPERVIPTETTLTFVARMSSFDVVTDAVPLSSWAQGFVGMYPTQRRIRVTLEALPDESETQ
jgi:hypothetical protein